MKKFALLILVAIAWCQTASAQDVMYSVQVGTFLDAKKADFNNISDLGFIYATSGENDLYTIHVGNFQSRNTAEQVLKAVSREGYPNAAINEMRKSGNTVFVVQIATRQISQPLDWDSFLAVNDQLDLIIGSQQVKVIAGQFNNIDAAKQQVEKAKQAGFSDAFAKKVDQVVLHPVGLFEFGALKRPLIPLNFTTAEQRQQGQNTPSAYNTSTPQANLPQAATLNLPNIRTKVKRNSVLNLQKLLKGKGTYQGSLDGYYGKNTENGFETVVTNSRTYKKYELLGGMGQNSSLMPNTSELQTLINTLNQVRLPFSELERYNAPIANAYRAYLMFTLRGASQEVNTLMNAAIKGAFGTRKTGALSPVDPSATYAYNDLNQLILHLLYVHSAPSGNHQAPCWLFDKHQLETATATNTLNNYPGIRYEKEQCNQFIEWEPIRTLEAIAMDLNSDDQINESRVRSDATARNNLYLAKNPISNAEKKALEEWDNKLWAALDSWAVRDPLHANMVDAMKAAYYQSFILLEDHFMDKGFKPAEARGLALATLHTVVGYHLERFA